MRIFESKSGKGWVVPSNGKICCFSKDAYPTMDSVRTFIKKSEGKITGGQGLGNSILFGFNMGGEDLGVKLTNVDYSSTEDSEDKVTYTEV